MTYLIRVLLVLVAATIAGVGGYMNGLFWWTVMRPVSAQAQIGFLVLSIACGAIKILVPACVAAMRLRWRSAPKAALAAFTVAILFDVASGLGYAGMTRAAATGEQREANRRFNDAVKARDAARLQLERMPEPSRSLERINADASAADARAGGCTDRKMGYLICAPVVTLRAEAADATAWRDARTALGVAEHTLSTLPAPRDPDPQLAAIENALGMLEIKVRRERLEAAWGLLMLLLLEFGAFPLIAFALAPVVGERPRERPGTLPPAPPLTPEQDALLAVLRSLTGDSDGWCDVSLAGLAKATGRHPSTVSRDVERLVAAGRIAKRTRGNRGFQAKVM